MPVQRFLLKLVLFWDAINVTSQSYLPHTEVRCIQDNISILERWWCGTRLYRMAGPQCDSCNTHTQKNCRSVSKYIIINFTLKTHYRDFLRLFNGSINLYHFMSIMQKCIGLQNPVKNCKTELWDYNFTHATFNNFRYVFGTVSY